MPTSKSARRYAEGTSVPTCFGDEEIDAIALACHAVERVHGPARHRLMNWLVAKYLGDEALAAVDRVLPRDRARGDEGTP